ncbi:unnamed protein product [Caenorhabditis auriculariae]|uniref:Uncharacterized protein n=1 Tax=Caenorhabditis auriculariae TaxID=2777116 RepID=A0A8S1HLU0_9PELO|nr:unnamed protein product [Caenorhabditis auriculariae]
MTFAKREKSATMSEEASMLLVQLYLRDEEKYNSKVLGKTPETGKTIKQQCVCDWKDELAAIGCDRTEEQIYMKIKGDLHFVRTRIEQEKAEINTCGLGNFKKLPVLNAPRQVLYDHLIGLQSVQEMVGTFDGRVNGELEDEDMYEEPLPQSSITEALMACLNEVKPANEVEPTIPVMRPQKRPAPSEESPEIVKKRVLLLDKEIENADIQRKLLLVKLETAQIELQCARARAVKEYTTITSRYCLVVPWREKWTSIAEETGKRHVVSDGN